MPDLFGTHLKNCVATPTVLYVLKSTTPPKAPSSSSYFLPSFLPSTPPHHTALSDFVGRVRTLDYSGLQHHISVSLFLFLVFFLFMAALKYRVLYLQHKWHFTYIPAVHTADCPSGKPAYIRIWFLVFTEVELWHRTLEVLVLVSEFTCNSTSNFTQPTIFQGNQFTLHLVSASESIPHRATPVHVSCQ